MKQSDVLLRAAATGAEQFQFALQDQLRQQGFTIKEFAAAVDIPESTLYKISSGQTTNFTVAVLRKIYSFFVKLEREDGGFIAVVAPSMTLGQFSAPTSSVGRKILIREYPSNTIEDIILNAIRAENDGASAVACGVIASELVRDIVSVPIGIIMDTNVESVIRDLAEKTNR